MAILDPSTLETSYDAPGWNYVYNSNIDKLAFLLRKILALADVDTHNLRDGGILTWDNSAGKWKVKTYG